MSLPYLETDFGSWAPEGQHLRIEFSIPVLEEISALAVDGQYRFRHGGVEVGGALFGRIEGQVVRITAHRALACEHAFGPRFVLSDLDRQAMRDLVQAPRRDGSLAGLEAVGWYHSHTRSEIALSPRDLEVYDTFFPARKQVALIVRPEHFGPVRIGFFFRESDGSIRTESSYEELIVRAKRHSSTGSDSEDGTEAQPETDGDEDDVAPAEENQTSQVPEPPEPVPVMEAVQEGVQPAAELPAPDLPSFVQLRPRSSRKAIWLVLALIVAAVAGLAVERYYRLSPGQQPLSLWVADMGGQLLIEWDRSAKGVRDAQRGMLDVQDGKDRVTIHLDKVHLREGSIDYVRRAEVVDVRLRVEGGGRSVEEFLRFVGPPVQRAGAAEAELARRNNELQTEVENLKLQINIKDAQMRQLRLRLKPAAPQRPAL